VRGLFALNQGVLRIDFVRYLWMYVFEGMYADLDMIAKVALKVALRHLPELPHFNQLRRALRMG
jgi:mannosyltransferase OCH1-like enzyme